MYFNDSKWKVAKAIACHLAEGFSRCGVKGCYGGPTTWSFGGEDCCPRRVGDFDGGVVTGTWDPKDWDAAGVDEEMLGGAECIEKWWG